MASSIDPVDHAKGAARILHRQADSGDPAATTRLRCVGELSDVDEATFAKTLRRRHCLAAVAGELGFEGWSHLTAVMAGSAGDDFGTLLSPPGMAAYWNIWSAKYDEARKIREEHGGYLLVYKRQFLIVDRHYIAALGLDPDDGCWAAMGRDWVEPGDAAARARMYGTLFERRLDAVTEG